jgi:hypothetical protein
VAKSVLPTHDPRNHADPRWVREWIAGYATTDHDAVPLLDTTDHDIPVPFAAA